MTKRKVGSTTKNPPRDAIIEGNADGPEMLATVASTKHASDREAELLAEIERLRGELGEEKQARSAAEQAALEAAEAQGLFTQSEIREVPTGKTVTVQRLSKYVVKGYHDDGREILRATFRPVSLPTYFYKVDLPPSGGTDMKINGLPLYHGATYEVDVDTLRTMKDMVFRQWKHEREVRGSNENAYRKPQAPTLSGKVMGVRAG
jgi:uncharacterized small protein (DUF1192 family)